MSQYYHFYQRVIEHKDSLAGRKPEVSRVVKDAVKGAGKKATVHVHDTHFHVFASVEDRREFVSRIKEGIAGLEGIRWKAEHYLTPVASVGEKYVSQLLKDIHKEPGI